MTSRRAAATTDSPIHEGLERLTRRARSLIPPATDRSPQLVTPRRGLYVLSHHVATHFEAAIYDPMLCLILHGWKEMSFGGRTLRLGEGECALVSHDLPIVSRVRQAPYLVLLLNVDVDVVRGLYEDAGDRVTADTGATGLDVHRADSHLIDALDRYLALAESEADARVLGPALLREIHYRMLAAPFGSMLRSLMRHDSHASAIGRAIAVLRRDFRRAIVVEDLAREVGMSVSAFHKHFKAITCASPLQYQKGLRLLEARRMLSVGACSVTNAAFEVGYESPTQFSREYTRKFGQPPSKDLTAVRASKA